MLMLSAAFSAPPLANGASPSRSIDRVLVLVFSPGTSPHLVDSSSALHRTPQHTANPIAKPYVSASSALSGFDLLQRLFSAPSSAPPRPRVKNHAATPVILHVGFPIPFH